MFLDAERCFLVLRYNLCECAVILYLCAAEMLLCSPNTLLIIKAEGQVPFLELQGERFVLQSGM